jgi:hypothetical protein
MSPCGATAGKTREKEKIELVNLGGFNIARLFVLLLPKMNSI